MIPYAREAGAVLVLALLTWGGYGLYRAGYNAANARAERVIADMAKAEADAQAKARDAERRLAERNSEIEQKLAQELNNAKRREQNRVADLERGAVRLRREISALATASVSREAAATAESEAAAARGAELVAAAVGVGAACDARVQALIEAYEATP